MCCVTSTILDWHRNRVAFFRIVCRLVKIKTVNRSRTICILPFVKYYCENGFENILSIIRFQQNCRQSSRYRIIKDHAIIEMSVLFDVRFFFILNNKFMCCKEQIKYIIYIIIYYMIDVIPSRNTNFIYSNKYYLCLISIITYITITQ